MSDIPQLTEAAANGVPLPTDPLNGDETRKGGGLQNYAENADVRERVKREIVPLLMEIRKRRTPLQQMWQQLFKVWTLEHEEQGYQGRSNIYVPAGKKGTETITSQLVMGTFPGDDNFGVEARDSSMAGDAEATKAVLQHRIENTSRVRASAEKFYRQLALTGNSPVKCYYDRRSVKGKMRTKGGLIGDQNHILSEGPVFEPIDVQNVYVFPEDVNDLKDVEIIFQDMSLSYAHLRKRAAQGVYVSDEVDKAKKGTRNPEKERATISRMQAQGFTSSHDAKGNDGWQMVDVTEVWVDFDPGETSREDEDECRPMLITVTSSGEVLRVIDNPFWHKRSPILWGRMGTTVERFYGTGYVEAIRELNLLLNDQTNQAMDCATYALNPILLTNPNAILGTVPDLEPGVQILVQDINAAIKFERPPVDMIQSGSILTAQTQSWISDYVGAPPVLSGGSAPGRAFRTATGIGTAQQNAKVPLQEVVRLCEVEVWEPMLFMFNMLDQQFSSDVFLKTVGGPGMRRITPEALSGDWVYKWLASTQTANQQVKGSQIIQLLQVLSAPPMQMMFKEKGLSINPAPLVKRLYQEVYGFRDVDKVIIEAALGGMPGTPGAPGQAGPQNVQGPDAEGFLPGNDEATSNRQESEEISSELGSLLGGMNIGMGEGDLTEEGVE